MIPRVLSLFVFAFFTAKFEQINRKNKLICSNFSCFVPYFALKISTVFFLLLLLLLLISFILNCNSVFSISFLFAYLIRFKYVLISSKQNRFPEYLPVKEADNMFTSFICFSFFCFAFNLNSSKAALFNLLKTLFESIDYYLAQKS